MTLCTRAVRKQKANEFSRSWELPPSALPVILGRNLTRCVSLLVMVSKTAQVLLLGNLISWPENIQLLVSPVLFTFKEERIWVLCLLSMPRMRVRQNHLLMYPWHGCLCIVREEASGVNISQVPSLWFSSLEVMSFFPALTHNRSCSSSQHVSKKPQSKAPILAGHL